MVGIDRKIGMTRLESTVSKLTGDARLLWNTTVVPVLDAPGFRGTDSTYLSAITGSWLVRDSDRHLFPPGIQQSALAIISIDPEMSATFDGH